MKIRRVKLGESDATEYTYDNGEVWTIVDNPLFDGSVVAKGPNQTITGCIFDFGADVPNSEKFIEMYKEAKKESVVSEEAKPTPKLSQFNIPYFNGLEKFLEDYGFKPTKFPWRYEGDRYTIVQLEDSDGNEEVNPTIYGIDLKELEERVYRGRLFDSTHAAYIFGMVSEHRYLTGKDDFPKLPIEPVKFSLHRTSIYGNAGAELTNFPDATVEEEPICYGDALTTPSTILTKSFTTARELVDYMKEMGEPLVIEEHWNKCIPYPRLEIYDDYRE